MSVVTHPRHDTDYDLITHSPMLSLNRRNGFKSSEKSSFIKISLFPAIIQIILSVSILC